MCECVGVVVEVGVIFGCLLVGLVVLFVELVVGIVEGMGGFVVDGGVDVVVVDGIVVVGEEEWWL